MTRIRSAPDVSGPIAARSFVNSIPYCCNGVWDFVCGRKARENCPNICDCESFGDFDLNLAVDLRDIAAFLVCFTGPGNPPVASGCECADYDADNDADLDDFVLFAALLTP